MCVSKFVCSPLRLPFLLILIFALGISASAQNPVHLNYATYLDGSTQDEVHAMVADQSGALYVVGITYSADFPVTPGALQTQLQGQGNAYIAKIKPDGSGLEFSTFFGTGVEWADAIALDPQGNIYVAGHSNCSLSTTPLPATPGAIQSKCGGMSDVFLLKLDPTASQVLYLTYLGGNDNDQPFGIKVDAQGNAYVAGTTASTNFPTTPGAYQPNYGGREDAFVAKVNPTGTALLYSTYIGGSSLEDGESLAIDAAGNAYIAGGTSSLNFPVTAGAYQSTLLKECQTETCGGFVSKLSPDGGHLVWSTYFGMPSTTIFFSIALDSAGDPVVSGKTVTGFPATPGTYSHRGGGDGDAFLAKLKNDGTGLIFLSYFGGSGWDGAQGVAVDGANNIWIGGRTSSSNLPLTDGAWNGPCTVQPNYFECEAAFIAEYSGDGTKLLYSSYLTATSTLGAGAWTVAADANGNGYIGGYAFPGLSTSPGAFQPLYQGANEHAFVAKFGPGTPACTNCTGSISASPAALQFIASAANVTSDAQIVTVTNSGTLPVSVASVNADAPFAVTNACSATLAPGAQCTIAVTFTAAAAASGALTITPSTGTPVTVQLSGSIATTPTGGGGGTGSSSAGFSIAAPSTTVPVDAKGNATAAISVLPQLGFTGTVTFSCTGLPAGATCTFSPQSVAVSSASAPTSVTVTITLPQTLMASFAWWWWLLPLSFWSLVRNRKTQLIAIALSSTLLLVGGCRGLVPGLTQVSAAKTYQVTVLASSGNIQNSAVVNVQAGGH